MITPDVFCAFYGLDMGIIGRASLNGENYDLFCSDGESFHSLYFNDVWKLHNRTPDVDYYEDRYCDTFLDPNFKNQPLGTTATFLCIEGI